MIIKLCHKDRLFNVEKSSWAELKPPGLADLLLNAMDFIRQFPQVHLTQMTILQLLH